MSLFYCQECGLEFDETEMDDMLSEDLEVECPECGSTDLDLQPPEDD